MSPSASVSASYLGSSAWYLVAPSSAVGIEALGEHVTLGEALGVAAEEDVDAAAGHVGGHGDRIEPAGLGDDVRLTRVLLGVEHLVGDAPLLELRQSFSDFSTEIVPTSTGWPVS